MINEKCKKKCKSKLTKKNTTLRKRNQSACNKDSSIKDNSSSSLRSSLSNSSEYENYEVKSKKSILSQNNNESENKKRKNNNSKKRRLKKEEIYEISDDEIQYLNIGEMKISFHEKKLSYENEEDNQNIKNK